MTDKYGSSPLSVAAARNHPEVASLLRQYSAMQRGVQDLTPDTEAKDPFADRRGSCDVHRGAAIVIPPVRPTATHQKETSSQSLLIPAVRASSSTRSPGQRRISLPSIIESPSSPNVSAPPRQSCDFDRTPQSTEPLVRSTASIRSTPSQPTRNITLTPTKMAERPVKTLMRGPSDPSLQTTPSKEPTSRSMRRSHTAQSGTATPTSYLTAPEPTSMKRRKSMESAALLSPQSAQAISRRKSFDQLSSLTRPDSKSRRSSDASSTTSQKTTSSGTTTRTSLSDHRPESIHNGMEAGSNSSNNSSSSVNSANSRSSNKKSSMATHHPHHQSVDPGNAMDQPFLLAPSLSQSTLESSRPKRPPVSFAMDVTARQSLDLQRLAMNLDRTADKDRNMEPKNDSETDLPSLLFRRRTMQETQHPKLSNMALRYHSVGPVMEALNGSSISDEYQAHQLQRSNGSSSSLQDMSGGASDIGGERGGLGVHRNSIGSAPSGSATVSGRFSRMWTTSNASSKENLNVPEFGEMQLGGEVGGGIGQGPPSSPGLARSDNSRSRGSMLNRLSGIWSRR
ncbi:hypothetical protein EDD11_006281 [Mortierella claussenii]|nr:hypothetical protein EDD11_006281 [Mortierella claussenii]